MVKKIWLINQYAMPPRNEMRIQTLKRAEYLIKNGWDVTVFCGSYLHNTDINLINDSRNYLEKEYHGIKFIHIKNLNYGKSKVLRIYSTWVFYFRFFWISSKFESPKIISHISTIPFGLSVYFISRKLKSKYVLDIVDLWPESLVSFGLVSRSNLIVKLAYKAEKWLYEKADKIIFSMEGGQEYLKDKRWTLSTGGKIDLSKVYNINNGVDLKEFDKNKQQFIHNDIDLKNNNLFKVIYVGSIRKANNLKLLIQAAEILIDTEEIKFLIYGDGNQRQELEIYCRDNSLNNVLFKDKFIEIKYIPYILSRSSLNILNYQPNSIFKYGGSQSKLFQYMASGKPICSNISMGYCPIRKYNLGISKEFSSAREYANTIKSFFLMPQKSYNKICSNSRRLAEYYDYQKLTEKYISIITQ